MATGLLGALGAILGGLSPAGAATAAVSWHADAISERTWCETSGLIMEGEWLGLRSYTDGRRHVALMPGISASRIDGRAVMLPWAPAWEGGRLVVPEALLSLVDVKKPPSKIARKALFFIDPGHGGHDPGTMGHGLEEKAINMEIALVVERALKARGHEVRLTRGGNRFLTLEERSHLGNLAGADCFVSIHANSSPSGDASGCEVYTLGDRPPVSSRADEFSHRYDLAAWNGGSPSGAKVQSASLFRIVLSEADLESHELAGSILARVVAKAGCDSRGIKEANFAVLRGTVCPAVLVEVGFVSNGAEAARLATGTYRRKLGDGIADGILDYWETRAR